MIAVKHFDIQDNLVKCNHKQVSQYLNKEWINCSCHFAIAIFISAQIFEFIALPILHVPIRYLPMMTMRNVIIETINSFLKPFIKFSTLLIKQDDNHEQQNQCHHHPFFLLQIFP